MNTVEAARATMLGAVQSLGSERVILPLAVGRTLAESAHATRDQPPFRSSAMDGYALRAQDSLAGAFTVVGESAAGSAYETAIGPHQAVRIFTGAPVPLGAESVIPQEGTRRDGAQLFIDDSRQQGRPAHPGRNIRAAAIDFAAGTRLIDAGTRLHPRHIALLAAAGIGALSVARIPRIAVLATGSELAAPGNFAGPYQIYDSVSYGLGAMIDSWGGQTVRQPIAPDTEHAVVAAIDSAVGQADLMVIVGGASVGDYDIVKRALSSRGLAISVPKIAVRPGKPTWFGALCNTPVLGLPGNPAAAFVCAHLFLRPLIDAFLARRRQSNGVAAVLDGRVEAQGENAGYSRAHIRVGNDARVMAHVFGKQDTSLVSIFAVSNALIRTAPNSPAAESGAIVDALLLDCD